MALKPLDPSVIEQSQTELKQKLASGSAVPQDNVNVVSELGNIRSFEFPAGSGDWFDVPNVPYVDGLNLKELFLRISLSQQDTNHGLGFAIYERQLKEMLDIAWRLSVPRKRWMRIAKRLTKWNPFIVKASEGDISVLLGFFLVRRMMCNVQFHYPGS
jgi:hypothetical protein